MTPALADWGVILGMILTAIGWVGIIHTLSNIQPPEVRHDD